MLTVLIIHLLLALSLMAVVLLQRSEGGGLGIGGGAMGPQAGRPPLTGLAKATWGLAVAFICTSLTLTVIAASNSTETSILERIGLPAPQTPASPDIQLPNLQLPPVQNAPLLPPVTTEAPVVPQAPAPEAPAPAEAPATGDGGAPTSTGY